jgi:protease IV
MQKSILILLGIIAGVVFIFFLVTVATVGARGSELSITGKSVGLVEVEGVISDAKQTVSEIREFTKESNVPVILLRVNSPGGAVAPSQEIYEALRRAQAKGKKIVVSMGTLAASGGYFISAPADVIVANPSTITGSIGVIMEFPNVEGLFKKLGLGVEVVKSREFKDIGSPYRPMTPEEKGMLKDLILDVYDQFTTVVAEGRKLPMDSVLKIADGRVVSGRQAKALGLVDSLGTYDDAVRIAGHLAGITGEPKVVHQPKPFRLRDFLTDEIGNRLTMPKLEYRFQ